MKESEITDFATFARMYEIKFGLSPSYHYFLNLETAWVKITIMLPGFGITYAEGSTPKIAADIWALTHKNLFQKKLKKA